MSTPARVYALDALPEAARGIKAGVDETDKACRERLAQIEHMLDTARQEEGVSRGLLNTAKGVEAAAFTAKCAAEARMAKAAAEEAAALASGNPVAIAAATAAVASAGPPLHKALQAHKEAVEHRRRLEKRCEKAVKCVDLASDTLKKLQTAFRFGIQALRVTGAQGTGRLASAYEDLRKYDRRIPAFPTLSMVLPPEGGKSYGGNAPAGFPKEDTAQMETTVSPDTGTENEDDDPVRADGLRKEVLDGVTYYYTEKGKLFRKDLDGTSYYYDDNGTQFRVDHNLLPNGAYELNGYRYRTDHQGRIASVEGSLHMRDRAGRLRIRDSLDNIGKGDQKEDDVRGHLIGDQFDGANGLENMIPQNASINRQDFENLENQLARLVRDGQGVNVKIEPYYSGDSRRPDAVVMSYRVDGGDEQIVIFPND